MLAERRLEHVAGPIVGVAQVVVFALQKDDERALWLGPPLKQASRWNFQTYSERIAR